MQADDLLRALDSSGEAALKPWFLVLGEEAFLADAVTRKLRQVAAIGGIDGFNEDKFTAGEAHVDSVLAAARSVPMMAKRRFVLVRSLERWEGKGDDAPPPAKKGKSAEHPLDRLAAYVADPSPLACVVLVAEKLHAQRKVVTAAKKANVLVTCDPIKRGGAGPWLFSRAKSLGHGMSRDVAEHVVDLVGAELGPLAEALDRLSLYVGPGAPIGDEAVSKLIAPVRHAAMWDLTDAVCAKNLKKALKVLGELELGRGAELPTLGAIASSVRKLAK
ncbi:MAG: DNA polymerase III subunit delta, partial [Myxococcales bacterium]|nr:DNA polymerase III subunit delta [Myxococcales bacterium]